MFVEANYENRNFYRDKVCLLSAHEQRVFILDATSQRKGEPC